MSYSNKVVIMDCCPTNSSPVSVVEGCIAYNDAKTKAVIEFTFKNEDEKALTATGVRINIYDIDGQKIGSTIKCWYKNLHIEHGKIFGMGQKIPVTKDAATFDVEVGACKFADGSVWQTENNLDAKTFKAYSGTAAIVSEDEKLTASNADTCETEAVPVFLEEPENRPQEPELSPEELERIQAEKEAKRAARNKIIGKVALIAGCVIVLAVAAYLVINVVIPNSKYNSAVSKMNAGEYDAAMSAFADMGDYKDAEAKIAECMTLQQEANYQAAVDLMNAGKYEEAEEALVSLNGYKDSNELATKCDEATRADRYRKGVDLMKSGKYEDAKAVFEKMLGYEESEENIKECDYQIALAKLNAKQYEAAMELFDDLGNYKDSIDKSKECQYQVALSLYNEKKFDDSNEIFEKLGAYKDSAKKIHIHKYTDKITTEPTCTEKGIRTFTCSCGKSYTEDVDALGHSYSDVKVTKDPTCTSSGTKTLTCRCGDTKTETIPATGHNYTSQVTTQPTCTENGVTTWTCHCGDSYTEPIPATGHDYSGGTCWEAPTCRVCGHTEGKELGHTTSKGYCKRCGLYIRDGEEWDSMEDWKEYKYGSSDDDYDW